MLHIILSMFWFLVAAVRHKVDTDKDAPLRICFFMVCNRTLVRSNGWETKVATQEATPPI